MKSLSILFSFLILYAVNTSCQGKKCADFKTGVFESPDKTVSDIKIIRNDSVQIETSEKRNVENIYNVYWLSDCEYQLVLKESVIPQNNALTYKDTLRVSITGIEGDIYQYKALLKDTIFVGDLLQTKETVN